jgi:fimbrial chaperone protein
VNPVRVDLSSSARSEIVTLKNAGAAPASFEIQVRAWEQGADGEMRVAPTGDVVAFPLVVALAPGEERNVRVGAATTFGALEKSYRLFIQEMPPPEKSGGPSQVRVLTRVGIPVFLAPVRVSERAELKDLAVRGAKASFRLVNGGTVHVRPAAAKVSLHGAGGDRVSEQDVPTWYVLAGGQRAYEVALPAERCADVREVKLVVTLDVQKALRAASPTPDGVCER